MKTSIASLIALAAGAFFGGAMREMPPPVTAYGPASRSRSRTPGPVRPSGSKLARQAEKHRVGIAELR